MYSLREISIILKIIKINSRYNKKILETDLDLIIDAKIQRYKISDLKVVKIEYGYRKYRNTIISETKLNSGIYVYTDILNGDNVLDLSNIYSIDIYSLLDFFLLKFLKKISFCLI